METLNLTTDNFYSEFPTSSQIQSFIKSAEQTFESINQNRDYRMENYYNCIDDYSWGGICDKAADKHERMLKYAIKELEYQETIAVREEEFTQTILTDLDGNIVSEQIVNGKYGDCWIIKEGENVSFCSIAKKMDTYNKKGLKIMERVYKVEFYYTTKFSMKCGLITKSRILSSEIRDCNDLKFQTTRLNSIVYFALN